MPSPLTVALSPPEALASYAQELDEIVETLPLFVGQDRLEHVSIKRMRLPHIGTPPIAGGLTVTISGNCSQRGKCLRSTSDGNTGTRRSSQGRTGKIEAKGSIDRREGNAKRGGFSKPRVDRRQRRKPGIEKETGELETTWQRRRHEASPWPTLLRAFHSWEGMRTHHGS